MCNGMSKQKLDPDLQKNGNFLSNLAIFLRKKNCRFAVACDSGVIHAQT